MDTPDVNPSGRTVSLFGEATTGRGVRTASVMIVDTVESVATKERLGQNRADELTRTRSDRILRKAISQGGGSTVKGMGDGVLAIFGSASSALVAACSALQAMDAANQSMSEPVAFVPG